MQEYWKNLSLWDKVKFVFSIILGVLGVVFATLNWKEQEVHIIFKKTQLPLSLLIMFSIAVGYAWAFLFNFRKFRMKDKEIGTLMNNIDDLKAQLKDCIEVKKEINKD